MISSIMFNVVQVGIYSITKIETNATHAMLILKVHIVIIITINFIIKDVAQMLTGEGEDRKRGSYVCVSRISECMDVLSLSHHGLNEGYDPGVT